VLPKILQQSRTTIFRHARNIKVTRSTMQMLAITRTASSSVLPNGTVSTGYP